MADDLPASVELVYYIGHTEREREGERKGGREGTDGRERGREGERGKEGEMGRTERGDRWEGEGERVHGVSYSITFISSRISASKYV